jgi:chemotaxis protein MotA
MDIALILGLIMGFGMLLTGFSIEGGSIPSLVAISPMFVVFGGTLGAVMTQFPMHEVMTIPLKLKYALSALPSKDSELIETLVTLTEKARREGILSLENDLADRPDGPKYDPMLKKGARLAVDGIEPQIISEILENEIFIFEHKRKNDAAVFEAAGGYSPTMGIIGTVMGLVMVLGNMDKPSELGGAIAAAFIATLYGVAFANLVYLPIAGKIKFKAKREALQKQLIKEGIMSIQAGENSRILREKLEIFSDEKRKEVAKT